MKTLKNAGLYDEGKSLMKDDRPDSLTPNVKVHQTDRQTDMHNFTCDSLQLLRVQTYYDTAYIRV
jgi:hypothetical protein